MSKVEIIGASKTIRFYDADNSNYIDIVCPATVASNKTITLPDSTFTIPTAGGSFKGDESMFLVTKTSDQSISHDTQTLVTWDTAYINVGSDFDLSTEKFTCPSDGKYLFTWGINLTANENAKFELGGFYFFKNNSHDVMGGNTQELSSLSMDMRGNPTRGTHISNTVIVDCSTSDYFTIKGFYNDVDGSGDQGGLISQYYTSWGGYKLTD